MEFRGVRLHAPEHALQELVRFYGDHVGTTRLEFVAGVREPFYHVALLVPGDRFDAALSWARNHVDLLPGGDVDDVVFAFDSWQARACYFLDAAGNIVELIAHAGIGENGREGAFEWAELLGISELGLVGEPDELVAALAALGLRMWDGSLDLGHLAFVGERARTLIVVPPGRGWLPTGRPVEPHPVEVALGGVGPGVVRIGPHLIGASLRPAPAG